MRKIHLLPAIGAALLLSAASLRAEVETYQIDPVHSTIGFKVRHFTSKVTGRFAEVKGTIKLDSEHPDASSVDAVIQVKSIDTANQKRDEHLKSADFFDAAKFGEITFKSKQVKQLDKQTADVVGDLTLHGVTKEVTLHVTFLGKAAGMNGTPQTGWEATAKINRTDFGLAWNKVVEGTSVVGDDVEINLEIESDLVK